MKTSPRRKHGPDFLVVGAQKCGTTAFHDALVQHPNVFAPHRKELHYFDKEERDDWEAPGYSWYRSRFKGKLKNQIAFEATPIYAYWDPCMERIRKYNPDMRLIMLVRDPSERAYSQWCMETARGNESLPFSRAIRDGRERMARCPDPLDRCHRVYSYVERGLYSQQIDRILEHFPAEQLLVLRQEALWNDLRSAMDATCAFLDISPFEIYPNKTPRRMGPTIRQDDLRNAADRDYLQGLFEDDIQRTESLTGFDLSSWLR